MKTIHYVHINNNQEKVGITEQKEDEEGKDGKQIYKSLKKASSCFHYNRIIVFMIAQRCKNISTQILPKMKMTLGVVRYWKHKLSRMCLPSNNQEQEQKA